MDGFAHDQHLLLCTNLKFWIFHCLPLKVAKFPSRTESFMCWRIEAYDTLRVVCCQDQAAIRQVSRSWLWLVLYIQKARALHAIEAYDVWKPTEQVPSFKRNLWFLLCLRIYLLGCWGGVPARSGATKINIFVSPIFRFLTYTVHIEVSMVVIWEKAANADSLARLRKFQVKFSCYCHVLKKEN